MDCKDFIKKLACQQVQITLEMREHLRNCADCRLLVRITGSPKVIELPSRPNVRNAS